MAKRVFLVILDSFGLGGAPDEADFKDEGSNTLAAVLSDSDLPFPGLARMGLFDVDGEDDERIIRWKQAQDNTPAEQIKGMNRILRDIIQLDIKVFEGEE